MCAITGIVLEDNTNKSKEFLKKIKDMFTDTLVSSVYGGTSATGVMILNKGFKVFWAKHGVPSPKFVVTDQYKKVIENITPETLFIVGHCRAATVGNSDMNINNHPHQCGNTIGVHHGFVKDHDEIAKKYGIPLKGQCDSELLISTFDILKHRFKWDEKRIGSFIENHIEANYAVALFNKHTGDKLVLLRDKQRLELHSVSLDSHKLCVFNSKYNEVDRLSTKYGLNGRKYIQEFSGRENNLAVISSPTEMDFVDIG